MMKKFKRRKKIVYLLEKILIKHLHFQIQKLISLTKNRKPKNW